MRQTMELGDLWRFCPDPHRDGDSLGFWRPDREFPLWREVGVPSCFEAGCHDIDFYEGVCWYRRSFAVPDAWRGRRLVLRFEAVNYRAKVWLNGAPLGEHTDGFLPFELDVTDTLRWDGANLLAVSVDNAHHEGDVPGMHVGWRGYGGIIREVSLYTTGMVHLLPLRIAAEPDGRGGRLELRARIRNSSSASAEAAIHVSLQDDAGNQCLPLDAPAVRVEPGSIAEVTMKGRLPKARPWSPATPVLYQATCRLTAGGETFDEVTTPFGFRRIETTPSGLLWNGERIFLTGFNRHEDSPRTAMATDLATARRDLEQMKAAGANFVRLCHYPHHPAELDLCDQLGLVAFCEVPLYFWNRAEEGRLTNPLRVETAFRQIAGMIERDFNHPSIGFWSVSNETHEEEPAVAESNRDLIRRTRALDPSRLVVHVSNRWIDHPSFDEDSVICVNTYPTMDFERMGHDPTTFDVEGSVRRRRALLEELHGRYPDKPVLVTEFGYCSFAGTHANSFGEDEHARSIETEFASFDAPYFCGATIWCWADHPWPGGRFLGGLTISPFGVVSRGRRLLAPYRTATRVFRARQGLPPLTPGGEPTGAAVIMVRSHMRDIPQYPFPAGHGLRGMTTDDIGLWTDIQRDAEPYFAIGDTLFRDEFGDDMEAIGRRCFIVTDDRGLGVGTISAWYDRDFRGREYGRIHWVAIRPRYQRKGLARAALSVAMQTLSRWHDRSYLLTSGERIGAIALYLGFGFEPDMVPANARAAWEEVGRKLDHPAIRKSVRAAGGAANH
jgi:beta-glucuronidase